MNMPELPEVETTLRGIKPYISGQRVTKIIIRHTRLRWPVPADLALKMKGKELQKIRRRGKYLRIN